MFSRTTLTARTHARAAIRQLHASPVAAKVGPKKVAEVADEVPCNAARYTPHAPRSPVCLQINKTLGKGLASAIESGENLTEKTKETLGAAIII